MIFKSKPVIVIHPVIGLDGEENVVNGSILSRWIMGILSGNKGDIEFSGKFYQIRVSIRIVGLDFEVVIFSE